MWVGEVSILISVAIMPDKNVITPSELLSLSLATAKPAKPFTKPDNRGLERLRSYCSRLAAASSQLSACDNETLASLSCSAYLWLFIGLISISAAPKVLVMTVTLALKRSF